MVDRLSNLKFSQQITNSPQRPKSPIETHHHLNPALSSLQSHIPLSSLLFPNLGMPGLGGLSSAEINSLQHALQAQQANFQQQLQNYMLMHSANTSSVSAQAQAAAQILMQNQVSKR
jgi:hypothetical protein